MPRDGTGFYTLSIPDAVPNTTIESALYNTFIHDVAVTFNTPLPILYGGTGATSAAEALQNLMGDPATLPGKVTVAGVTVPPAVPPAVATGDTGQLAVDKPASGQSAAILGQTNGVVRWRLVLGDPATEIAPQEGSNFRIERYTNTGAFIDFPVYIERKTGQITLTGAPVAPDAILSLNSINNTAGTTAASIAGRRNGQINWGLSLGDGTAAADFRLNRFISGTLVDVPFVVTKATGKITMNGAPPDQQAILHINKISGAGGQAAAIQGQTGTVTRWHLALGDGIAEGGGNTGSDFKIHRHADNGAFIDPVFQIQRNTGFCVFWKDTVYKPSGGFFTAPSDARIKTVIDDYDAGLAEVKAINPVWYKFKSTEMASEKEYIGLIAQDVETVMPEMVSKVTANIDGVPVDDFRVLDTSALIYALVNAVKELSYRVQELEAAKT